MYTNDNSQGDSQYDSLDSENQSEQFQHGKDIKNQFKELITKRFSFLYVLYIQCNIFITISFQKQRHKFIQMQIIIHAHNNDNPLQNSTHVVSSIVSTYKLTMFEQNIYNKLSLLCYGKYKSAKQKFPTNKRETYHTDPSNKKQKFNAKIGRPTAPKQAFFIFPFLSFSIFKQKYFFTNTAKQLMTPAGGKNHLCLCPCARCTFFGVKKILENNHSNQVTQGIVVIALHKNQTLLVIIKLTEIQQEVQQLLFPKFRKNNQSLKIVLETPNLQIILLYKQYLFSSYNQLILLFFLNMSSS
eukprot:TRINITY_DN8317_c1_g1_i3.p1 TRINITY_DN8317_c1_g1~~TRINITY_DN8317_c1_g1_i3.p1  ORF type:complete len:299 (+),score=-16.52 TRINITY_DN8317_c1_g1_i3:271-1167(+)